MIGEKEILERVSGGKVNFPPLEFRLVQSEPRAAAGGLCDALIEASWLDFEAKFATEVRRYSSNKTVFEAARQACYVANQFNAHPLVVTPWLSPEQVESFEREQVSAIDLSGNGVVIIPGKILVSRSGKPNLFPDSRRIRNVYEGVSSLVARALLCKPSYESVNELLHEIRVRSGEITQSTVSKALKQLEEDVVVSRENGLIKLVQPEKVIDRLLDNFVRPQISEEVSGKLDVEFSDIAEFVCSLFANRKSKYVVSGDTSVNRYAAMAREQSITVYCDTTLGDIVKSLGPLLGPSSRFPNLRICRVKDPSVFFDRRSDGTIRWASPVQSYLELMTGDKREKETADQVRKYILRELRLEP